MLLQLHWLLRDATLFCLCRAALSDASRALHVRAADWEGAAASLQEKRKQTQTRGAKVSCPETQHRGSAGGTPGPGAQVCTRFCVRGHRALGDGRDRDSEWGTAAP